MDLLIGSCLRVYFNNLKIKIGFTFLLIFQQSGSYLRSFILSRGKGFIQFLMFPDLFNAMKLNLYVMIFYQFDFQNAQAKFCSFAWTLSQYLSALHVLSFQTKNCCFWCICLVWGLTYVEVSSHFDQVLE